MKTCVIYFSRTGKTKYMAQAIADAIKAPIFDLTLTSPSAIADYDLVVLGTPVEHAQPAKETLDWVKEIPTAKDKKAILFCTYKIRVGKTFKILAEVLHGKGYMDILEAQKRSANGGKTDFSGVVEKISGVL